MSEASLEGRRPHRGVLILVLGIVGIVVCMPVGIAAWVMGNGDLAAMARGEMDPEGRGLTQAGKICGMVSVALWVLWFAIVAMTVGFAGCAAALSGGGTGG